MSNLKELTGIMWRIFEQLNEEQKRIAEQAARETGYQVDQMIFGFKEKLFLGAVHSKSQAVELLHVEKLKTLS